MVDIVDPETRSRMMSGIGSRNTRPEIRVRKALHAAGFRFRLHRKDLPGKPDVVLPRYKIAIFVHGCFWHFHERCRYFRIPATRAAFWEQKLRGNAERDKQSVSKLRLAGWRLLIIWECFLRDHDASADLGTQLKAWIESGTAFSEMSGTLFIDQ